MDEETATGGASQRLLMHEQQPSSSDSDEDDMYNYALEEKELTPPDYSYQKKVRP